MKAIATFLIFIFSSTVFAESAGLCQTTARICEPKAGSRSDPLDAAIVDSCEAELKLHGCEKLKKEHPDLVQQGKLKVCDHVSSCTLPDSGGAWFRACMAAWGDTWIDMGKSIGVLVTSNFNMSEDELKRQEYFQSCTSPECKRRMLKGFASYFTKEEIEGHGPTAGMDIRDPADANYIEGYSAAVLYRKLLFKLKDEVNKRGMAEPFIEPWSNQPARLPRSMNEMIDDTLREAGLRDTACYTEEALVEMRCYAFFSMYNPSIVLGVGAAGVYLTKALVTASARAGAVRSTSRAAIHAPSHARPMTNPDVQKPETPRVSSESVSSRTSTPVPPRSAPRYPPVAKSWSDNNPYLRNPHHVQQGRFLQRVGVKLDENGIRADNPVQVAANYNSIVDDMIASGKIKPNEALFWSDTYVGPDGKLIFVRAGSSPPAGSEAFLEGRFRIKGQDSGGRNIYVLADASNNDLPQADGFLGNQDYYHAISQGYFPGSYSDAPVGSIPRSGGTLTEPLFFHDLAHVGGMVEHPAGMAAFRGSMSRLYSGLHGRSPSHVVDRRLFYVNERLPAFKPEATETFTGILRVSNIRSASLNSIDQVQQQINRVPSSQVSALAQRLVDFHGSTRSTFGGAVRSAGMEEIPSRLDLAQNALQDSLQTLAQARADLSRLPDQRQHSGRLIEIENDIRQQVSDYIFAVNAFNRTDMRGWFDLGITERPPQGAYRAYLCEGYLPEKPPGFC